MSPQATSRQIRLLQGNEACADAAIAARDSDAPLWAMTSGMYWPPNM